MIGDLLPLLNVAATLVVLFGTMFLWGFIRTRREQTEAALRAIAAHLKMKAHVDARWVFHGALDGPFRGRRLSVSVGRGRWQIEVGGVRLGRLTTMRVSREGAASRAVGLAAQDIQVGDPETDARLLIRGQARDAIASALSAPGVTDVLHSLFDDPRLASIELQDDGTLLVTGSSRSGDRFPLPETVQSTEWLARALDGVTVHLDELPHLKQRLLVPALASVATDGAPVAVPALGRDH